MARRQVADEGTASNMEGSCEYINKQSRTPKKGCPSAWGLCEVLTTPHRKNVSCYEWFTQKAPDLDLGDIDWIELAQDRNRWQILVNAVMNFRVT
jgi:hypothetical protein